MAEIKIKGVLRQINGIKGRADISANRVLFYKKDGKEYAFAFKNDAIVAGDNPTLGTSNIDYNTASEVTLYANSKAFQKVETGDYNGGSIAGIYADNFAGHTFTITNHPNFA